MSRRVFARSVTVLLLLGFALSVAVPAMGASQDIQFKYGTDQSSWYWTRQIDEEIAVDMLPPPAPAVVQRVRVPNPQNFDTLPVAVTQGEVEKTSAIAFDLFGRGLEAGSSISKLVLTIPEISGPNEFPTFNAEGRIIQACRIDDFWVAGDAEEFVVQPLFDESSCVDGVRDDEVDPPVWTWNLISMAPGWGEDPFASNGVLLRGKLADGGPTETWQINLKIPSRDDSETPNDEYADTKDRVHLVLVFTPPAATPPPPPPPDPGFVDPGLGTPPDPVISPPPVPDPSPVPSEDTGSENPTTEPVSATDSKIPAYVWLLIPVGLILLSGVRSVVTEPAGGPRPDGVIDAIRRRNAERRGELVSGPRPSRLAAPFVALFAAIGQDLTNARSKLKRKPS